MSMYCKQLLGSSLTQNQVFISSVMDSEIVCIWGAKDKKRQTLLDSSTTERCRALLFTHHTPPNIDNWKASVLNISVMSLVARQR